MYRGGQNFDEVKVNYDITRAEETISKHVKQIEFLNEENRRLESEMQEIKELLGICESKDPTDKDRVHLKTLVRSLKKQNDQLKSDSKLMEKTLGDLKAGRFNMAEGGRALSENEVQRLKSQLEEVDSLNSELMKKNQKLESDIGRIQQQSSASSSN